MINCIYVVTQLLDLRFSVCNFSNACYYTPWTQRVNSTYIRRSVEVLNVFWTSYVRSIYVLYPRGRKWRKLLSSILSELLGLISNWNIKLEFIFSWKRNLLIKSFFCCKSWALKGIFLLKSSENFCNISRKKSKTKWHSR